MQDGYQSQSLDQSNFYVKLLSEFHLAITLKLGPFEFLEASDRMI